MTNRGTMALVAGTILSLAGALGADAHWYWRACCDWEFDSWAKANGRASGNAAIESMNWDVIEWAYRNTDLYRGGYEYAPNGAWVHHTYNLGSWLNEVVNMYPFHYKSNEHGRQAFTGRADSGGYWGIASWPDRCYVVSTGTNYGAQIYWRGTSLHEAGHIWRGDYSHHTSVSNANVWCVMQYPDHQSGCKILCSKYCIPLINARY